MCCPNPPEKRVLLSLVLDKLAEEDEGRCVFNPARAGHVARLLGVDGGNGKLRPLGVVWARAVRAGLLRADSADHAPSRYLLAVSLLQRDGLATLAVLAALDDVYQPAGQVAAGAAERLRRACARWGTRRGVLSRRVVQATDQLAACAGEDEEALRRLRWRLGLLEDLGVAQARSYCRQVRLLDEGVQVAREAGFRLDFDPLKHLQSPHLLLAPWLARVPEGPIRPFSPDGDGLPGPERSLWEELQAVGAGRPAARFVPDSSRPD